MEQNASFMHKIPRRMAGSCHVPNSSTAVIVLGMSRSGTSLTTSAIAALSGGGEAAWRGTGARYPDDGANSLGYFERLDVVRLNYEALRSIGYSWTQFEPEFSRMPRSISRWPEQVRKKFLDKAAPIMSDMRRRAPFVLKDVRFSRTLPLWAPLLASGAMPHKNGSRRPSGVGPGFACVLPFRHPSEVALSSRALPTALGRMRLWQSYILAALASTRSANCPVLLVEYDAWFTSAAAQLAKLRRFLGCAGLRLAPGAAALEPGSFVHPEQRHHRTADRGQPLPADISCLLRALRSGEALQWRLDGHTPTPCSTPDTHSDHKT